MNSTPPNSPVVSTVAEALNSENLENVNESDLKIKDVTTTDAVTAETVDVIAQHQVDLTTGLEAPDAVSVDNKKTVASAASLESEVVDLKIADVLEAVKLSSGDDDINSLKVDDVVDLEKSSSDDVTVAKEKSSSSGDVMDEDMSSGDTAISSESSEDKHEKTAVGDNNDE